MADLQLLNVGAAALWRAAGDFIMHGPSEQPRSQT